MKETESERHGLDDNFRFRDLRRFPTFQILTTLELHYRC